MRQDRSFVAHVESLPYDRYKVICQLISENKVYVKTFEPIWVSLRVNKVEYQPLKNFRRHM